MDEIGIIIPFHNLWWMTKNCLESIKASGGNYKIYLISNGSDDAQSKEAEKYLKKEWGADNWFFINLENNVGFVKATNLGIKQVLKDGLKYFVMLNNDTLVTFNWLGKMYKSIKKAHIVGPMSSPPNWRELEQAKMIIKNKIPYRMVRNSMEGFGIQVEKANRDEEKEVEFLPFFCAMFKSAITEKIGFLNETYGMGLFDDNDYCHKAVKAGLKLILRRDVYIHHYHRSTWIEHKMAYSSILEKNRKKFIKLNGFDPWEGLKVE